jgi:Fic family protein
MEHATTAATKSIATSLRGVFSEPEYWSPLFEACPNDPVELAACFHHRIARSGYFGRFNGRAARLAMNYVLLAAGYPPISIPTDLRQDYYNALEAADSGDFQTWLNFLTEQLDHELDQWLSALEDPRPKT